jgi:hypothetical protein
LYHDGASFVGCDFWAYLLLFIVNFMFVEPKMSLISSIAELTCEDVVGPRLNSIRML